MNYELKYEDLPPRDADYIVRTRRIDFLGGHYIRRTYHSKPIRKDNRWLDVLLALYFISAALSEPDFRVAPCTCGVRANHRSKTSKARSKTSGKARGKATAKDNRTGGRSCPTATPRISPHQPDQG